MPLFFYAALGSATKLSRVVSVAEHICMRKLVGLNVGCCGVSIQCEEVKLPSVEVDRGALKVLRRDSETC